MKTKKTGIEEKMAKLREKLDREEGIEDPDKARRRTGVGLLNQEIIDRMER